MSTKSRVAFCLYLCVSVLVLIAGLTYLFRTEFMAFHASAVDQSWASLPPRFQALVLTLMKATGAAYVAIAFVFTVLLFIPFRQGARWANFSLLTLGLLLAAGSLNAMAYLYTQTNSPQPVFGPLAGAGLSLAGFLLAYAESKPKADA